MKHGCLLVIAICTLLFNSTAHAKSDQELLNEKLFQSVVENNIKKFQEYLELGADLNWFSDGETYPSSAFCEATKRGNEEYLEVIVRIVADIELVHGTGIYNGPAVCAVRYGNISAYRMVVNMGIDVTAVLDPEVPVVAQRTLLDLAISSRKSDIVWEMIQETEPSGRQINNLIRFLELFGGFEGEESRTNSLMLAQWLQDRGYEVNLKPPAPDPRTYKR